MAINTVTQSNNFETWRTITNEVVNKVNFLDSTGITGITGGNAIGVTTDGNKSYTVRFTGNVAGTVTFSGPVTFQNTLTASSLNVTSTKLPYTIPSGLTIGNFVRVDPTVGLTFAKADTADNSEILGMVVSSSQIAIAGQIDNTTFANTIRNSLGIVGGTLGKGGVYFLSPTVAGGITTFEPTAYGQVSKPVLLGITGDQGMLLPYRGVVIEGISAGITAELDNKIIIELDYSGLVGFTNGSNYASPTAIKLGDPVFYFTSDTNIGGGNTDPTTFLQGIKDTSGLNGTVRVKVAGVDSQNELAFFVPDWVNCTVAVDPATSYEYIGSKSIERGRVLGLVSEVVATPTTLGQQKYILEVTLPGGSIAFSNISELDSTFYSTTTSGSYYIQPHQASQGSYGSTSLITQAGADNFSASIERYKFLDIIKYSSTSGKIIFHYKTQPLFISEEYGEVADEFVASFLPSSSSTSVTGPSQFYNLLPNGAFTVWQRPFSGLTAGQINSNLYLTPVADRWFWTNWGVTGLTLSLTRSQFNSNQTEVPGSPLYYVNINTQYGLPLADPAYAPRLENIQKNARLLQGQTATLSFYAKSTVSGSTLDLTFNRYPEGIQDDYVLFETTLEGRQTIVAGITLTGSWAKYSQTFVVPAMGYTLTTEQDGWISFGFEFPKSSATLSIAQVILEQGYGSNMVGYINPQDELQRCKPYYQRSYDLDEAPRSTNSRGNEQVIQLGNLNGQIIYSVKFSTKMIETPSFITTYSPVTGTPTETYNVNAGQDLRYTTGTLIGYPWDVTPRYRQGAGLTGNVTIPNSSQHGFDIQLNSGAVSFDTIKFHWIANSDILYRG